MEESIKPISNVHIDHSILMESINKLDGDALQNFQDAIMGYVNYYYGNFIEVNLRTDPQFCHLFGNKISGKPVPSGKNNIKPKKLLDKVEGKSKMIKKTSKTFFENVAHVKEISANNLGSSFLKKDLKLSRCINENQQVYKKLSSIVPDQNNNIQCDEKNNSNQRIFFILKPQIENPIKASNNLSDKDMHSRDSNENIQQNEIYFSNSDYNEKNCDKNLSITFRNLDNQKEVQKGQKNMIICKNKMKLGTENKRNLLKANTKKKMRSQNAFEIEKYLRIEDLKKIERYKYNSGGQLKFCKKSFKKKCIYNFEGKEKNGSVQKVKITDKKDIPLKLRKLDLKRDSILCDAEKNIDSETNVVVGSTLNNLSLENEVSTTVDCNTNGISEVGKGLISQKIKEDKNVERSINIVQTSKTGLGNTICIENEDKQKSKPHRKQIIVDSLKIKNCMGGIHIFNSTSSLEIIGFPHKNDISIKNDKVFKNNSIKMVDRSGKGIEAITKEEYIKKYFEIDGQGLEKVTVNKEQNVSVECIYCNLNFSEITPGNLAKQIKTEHIRNNEIEKSVNYLTDVSPDAMSFNMKDSNHINSKNFSNVHDKVSSRKEIILQGSNESSSNSTKTSGDQNYHNSYVGPMKKYSSEPYAAESSIQLEDKMKTCEYSLLGVADEKTNESGVITVSRKYLNELNINSDLNLGTRSNTNLELDNKQFENIQQNANSVTYKIEEVSSIQLKKETITHLDQPETKNSPGSLKNTLKANIENKLSLNEISIRRSSLRNKTGTMLKKDVENHMLVKITYDKENLKKNNLLCKGQTVFDANEKFSKNGDTKENIDNGQTKTNFSYNLRSSFTKENTKILKKKNE
ncbi:hypothetical protein WA026_020514 [Henosepilachna vigintioctopunctata]|uniref:Uncharacterized protein n=1 Tax=Henosepilachna vigintioctopunctata TaxID=420089 RepID=A0AAW1VJ45_9CUCU